jgi:ribosomal protein S8
MGMIASIFSSLALSLLYDLIKEGFINELNESEREEYQRELTRILELTKDTFQTEFPEYSKKNAFYKFEDFLKVLVSSEDLPVFGQL